MGDGTRRRQLLTLVLPDAWHVYQRAVSSRDKLHLLSNERRVSGHLLRRMLCVRLCNGQRPSAGQRQEASGKMLRFVSLIFVHNVH